jgi:hypothetical protein
VTERVSDGDEPAVSRRFDSVHHVAAQKAVEPSDQSVAQEKHHLRIWREPGCSLYINNVDACGLSAGDCRVIKTGWVRPMYSRIQIAGGTLSTGFLSSFSQNYGGFSAYPDLSGLWIYVVAAF